MRIAYLECFSGISGDMFLGALVDAGVPPELFTRTVEATGVDARLEISRTERSGISATKVDVIAAGQKELPREEFWKQQEKSREHQHGGDQAHGHSHADAHDSEHGPSHKHSHHEHSNHHEPVAGNAHSHRGLKEIRQIIQKADIANTAKARAIRIFEALGAAEAKIHNTAIDEVHFHEVGAVDAIVDIVCAAVGAEALGVDEWICSPLNVGGGTVECAHGTFPIPAPATLELLRNAPIYSGKIQKELVTPTGAAIVNVLVSRYASFPSMKTDRIGYGAGTRSFPHFPNVVRLSVGRAGTEHAGTDEAKDEAEGAIAILEANLDDMTPQLFGYVMERALAAGALDVFGTAVQMKKNRPGMLLTVLCRAQDAADLRQIIFAETTTLGVRMRLEQRATLARHYQTVRTRWGEVAMKLANLNGPEPTHYAPEYEDCRRIAEQHHVPLKAVMQEAIQVYLKGPAGSGPGQ